MEQLSSVEREAINDELREYKRKVDYGLAVAQITTEGIEQAQVIEIEELEEVIVIPAYDITPEDQAKYEEYKRQRNEKVFNKFKGGEER